MTYQPTVLVFTNSEYGQANVNLATAYELAIAGANVHVGSFAPIKNRVLCLHELVIRHASRSDRTTVGSITFQECKGTAFWDCIKERGVDDSTLPHPRGFRGALESYAKMDVMCVPWNEKQYVEVLESTKEIIGSVKPDVVLSDWFFYFAGDACKLMSQKYMLMTPNSIGAVALKSQPKAAALWKYPAFSSGFTFPLKWWRIPANAYLWIRLVVGYRAAKNFQQVQSYRKTLCLKSMYDELPYRGVTYICPSLTEIDWPYATIPEEMLLCGPIVMPFDPVEESDPKLTKWLENGPTVMINLGSHVISDEKIGREVAGAIRILLDHHDRKLSSNIQVLWKAKANGEVQRVIEEILGKEIKAERVKVLAWLDAEPVSILQHPNLVCTVHHGGATSFHEGIWSGKPHIIISVWYDTYEYANRVEFLNVGVFGNKSCAPGVRAKEFGQALVSVTGDTEGAAKMRAAAERVKDICRAKGNGRELAAMAVLKEAGMTVRN